MSTTDSPHNDAPEILDRLATELGLMERILTSQSAAWERNGDVLSVVEARAQLATIRRIIAIVNGV